MTFKYCSLVTRNTSWPRGHLCEIESSPSVLQVRKSNMRGYNKIIAKDLPSSLVVLGRGLSRCHFHHTVQVEQTPCSYSLIHSSNVCHFYLVPGILPSTIQACKDARESSWEAEREKGARIPVTFGNWNSESW